MSDNGDLIRGYLPRKVNTGPWAAAYTLFQLREMAADTTFILPVCSIANDLSGVVAEPGTLLLPPLFREAMTVELRMQIIDRIVQCFPVYGAPADNAQRVQVVDLKTYPGSPPEAGKLIAFSVDTAVEEHGPHLPLATDTVQSYGVLQALAQSGGVEPVMPLEYGHLTWGLPFGFSIDLTAELVTPYVTGYVNCLVESRRPSGIYVVDVHGSIVHREAIVAGLERSTCENWAFRWLHEPLAEFASARGDQHAGGVETALVERVSSDLIDKSWFPVREDDIVQGQMSLGKAVELSADLEKFGDWVRQASANGIVGDVRNYATLDSDLMFDRMLTLAASDVSKLLHGGDRAIRSAGQNLW